MDVISDILRVLDLRSSVYFHSSFCGSWAIDGGNNYQATFHLIARGNCWLHLTESGQSIALAGGDLVVFPRDLVHTISDSQHPPEHIEQPPQPAADDEIPSASLICGYFDFLSPQANPLLDAMPDVLHIKAEDPHKTSAMNVLLNLITTETENDAPGSDTIVDRLTEILFIHIIRTFIAETDIDNGILAALTDPQLNKAVTAVHHAPGEKWSVEKLADKAGMSRSAFAKHFQRVTDMTPMQYVTRWRMQIAYETLRNSRTPVSVIAEQSGYQTEASFRKAFKETTGVNPGAIRSGKQTSITNG